MEKKKIIGIGIFVLLILLIIGIKVFSNKNIDSNLTTIYVATGGGKRRKKTIKNYVKKIF